MPAPQPSIPRSVLFRAPGRPLAADRQQQVRDRLCARLAAAASAHDLALGGDARRPRLEGPARDPSRLGDDLEDLLKCVVAGLDADLVGGPNVTRLDRVITCGHARLPYRKALRIVNGRGWSLALGENLPDAAQATLVRFCGLLPVQVLCLPRQPRPAGMARVAHGSLTLLPLAGATLAARVDGDRAVCEVDLDRWLQFVLGLAEVPRSLA